MAGITHNPQVAVAGEFLVVSRASITVNTTIHLMLNQRAQVLIRIRPLIAGITSDTMSAGDRHVLEQTLATFVANRAIMGVVEHQPFNDMFAKVHRLTVCGGHHHVVLGLDHATHLHPFKRSLQKFNGTHPTSTHRSQRRMIAKPGDHDA